MKIKKVISTAAVCAGLFALTVPSSFVYAGCPIDDSVTPSTAGCGVPECKNNCSKCKPQKCAKKCKPEKCAKKCKPEKCAKKCKPEKCAKKCKPEKCAEKCIAPLTVDSCGMVTGAAASMDCADKGAKRQVYAYPEAIYSPANTAFVGEEKNGALVSDDTDISTGVITSRTALGLPSSGGDCCSKGVAMASTGVLVEEGAMTGAAAVIDATRDIDDIITRRCAQFNSASSDAVRVESPTSTSITKRYLESCPGLMTGAAAGACADACGAGGFYPDVPDRFWASPEINALTEKGVLVGYPDGLFRPNRNITKAEMSSAIVKGYNLQGTPMTSEGIFKDVPEQFWAHDMINKSVSADMLEGYANGTFKPQHPLTMTQALYIVSKGLNCPMDDQKADEILSRYADRNQVPSWAKQGVAIAIENGALSHTRSGDSSHIHPSREASRAEVAIMLRNMRIAGGYDTGTKVVQEPMDTRNIKSFVEKEATMAIPTLELTMNDILNSKNANVGDTFAATTVNDVIIDGVVYPAGSRVDGKVMEIARPSKNCEGAMRLSFEKITDRCDHGCHATLPRQVLTARVDCNHHSNWFQRTIEFPFTWVGSLLGTAGRTVGGAAIALSNATENLFDSVGTGSAEILTGNFRAGGRSYLNAGKTVVMAPVDLVRTAVSGTAGLFQTTGDEFAYLFDADGNKISSVNPKQKITIAFGCE